MGKIYHICTNINPVTVCLPSAGTLKLSVKQDFCGT